MSEQKWVELSQKTEHLVSEYKKTKKERDDFKKEIEELQKQTTKLVRTNKEEMLLKERIKVLEKDRQIVREKVKTLIKILKEKHLFNNLTSTTE
ncbi:hypothetical protein KAS42_04100 [bacterium]|nr:hypothetical protein [bacterium]